MSVSQIREYAEMQRNRGRAYSLLKVGDKQANLERAIACYEKALQVYTREQYPKEWGVLHYDIGNIYQNLSASVSEKSTNLHEAIAHYEKALEVHGIHDERWAIIYFRHGEAYHCLPTGSRQSNLEKAIASYMRSLEVYTPKNYSAQWAMTHLCIGEALRNLPEGDQQDDKQKSFMHYQNALQVYTRQSFPREWAMTQRSLGDLYYSVQDETRSRFYSSHYSGPSQETARRTELDLSPNLRDAIYCYEGALQVYTREQYPIEWAATLYALASAYSSVRSDDQIMYLERAITSYQQVLQVYTLETAPIEWARTQWSLGDVSMRVDWRSAHKLASKCYELALQVYTREDFPGEWSTLQNNLQSVGDEQIQARMRDADAVRTAGDYTKEDSIRQTLNDVNNLGEQRNADSSA